MIFVLRSSSKVEIYHSEFIFMLIGTINNDTLQRKVLILISLGKSIEHSRKI